MNEPLDIALVSHAPRGGSGVIARELGAGLAQRGHRVNWFVTEAPGHVPEGVVLRQVAVPQYPVLDHAPSTIAMSVALAEFVDRVERPVIHVHYALPWAVSAMLARQMARRRAALVITLHGTDVTGVGADPAYARAMQHALHSADQITTPSLALLETHRTSGETPEIPAVVVPNFVDTSRFSAATPEERRDLRRLLVGGNDDLPWVIHLSNFRAVKDPETLAAVATRVATTRPCRIVLVGEGPERASVVSALQANGCGDRVIVAGTVTSPERWLRASDVLLLPSRQESFGLAALEAMSSGLTVVASDTGGLRELIEPESSGLLCRPGDVDGFVTAVIGVLDDEQLRARIGCAARQRAVAMFGRDVAVDRYVATYLNALEHAR